MAALIGALRVSLSADTAKFDQGMRRAQSTAARSSSAINKSLSGIKAGFASLGVGLSAGLFIGAIKSALAYAGSLTELAETLGTTSKDFQTFSFAAGQVGISQETLEIGLTKLSITMGKVAAGAKEPAKAFAAIGISVDQLKGKDTGEVFRLIAQKLEQVGDRSKRAAVEVALFGKSGAKLDNLLSGAEGRLDDLTAAAERLGIVLSDEQIQKADQTADKLAALQTVLKARIAGVVADNSTAVLDYGNSIANLATEILILMGAIGKLSSSAPSFVKRLADAAMMALNPIGTVLDMGKEVAKKIGGGSSSVTTKLPPLKQPAANGDISQFLAPAGGKPKKAREDHSAEDRLRDANQFDQDIRRAQMDVLRAQQDLAGNYIERTTIGIEILNAEQAARDAEHEYQIALFKLTKGKQGQSEAQVKQLVAQEAIVDALQRQKLLDEEQAQRAEDVQALTQGDFDRRKDALQAQLQIAETADERRKLELELLQIAYDQKRQALQNIIDTSKDIAAIENARRDLINLKSTFGNDRQAVIQNTRGPVEDFLASLPTTAAKANEALQRLEVEGFNGLIDSVLALSDGVHSATDALLGTLKAFLLGLARMELQRAFGNLLQGVKLPGFSSGGFTGNISPNRFAGLVHGGEGVLNAPAMRRLGVPALDALNRGAPLSAVVGNDNGNGGRSNVTMYVTTSDADSFRRSAGQTTRALKRQLA